MFIEWFQKLLGQHWKSQRPQVDSRSPSPTGGIPASPIETFTNLWHEFGIADASLLAAVTAPNGPLSYARTVTEADIDEGNDFRHSLRVLRACIALTTYLPERHALTTADKLVLIYASLFHDIAKSKNTEINKDIKAVLASTCSLFSGPEGDHGIRAAYYIQSKLCKKQLRLPGIGRKRFQPLLLSVIAHHSSGILDSSFGLDLCGFDATKLCMLFRLADIADGEKHRVAAANTVDPSLTSGKTHARALVDRVTIGHDAVAWQVADDTNDLRTAVAMANKELQPSAVLLRALCLPCAIKATRSGRQIPTDDHSAAVIPSLTTSAQPGTTLTLRADSFPVLYEQIVLAMYPLSAHGVPSANHYCGPVLLEVRDSSDDHVDKTSLRNQFGLTYQDVRRFMHAWMSSESEASDEFYFGYTHGQRIFAYLYPKTSDDFKNSPRDFKLSDWTGKLDQFPNCVDVLRTGGADARRAYLSIAHPLIDTPGSPYYKDEEIAPSLMAVHFRIEGNSLSGFAFLRSQELSLFSVVNYLEIKTLIQRLVQELRTDYPDLTPGRIVMMSSLAYFDPHTRLFFKPEICRKNYDEVGRFGRELANHARLEELQRLLEEFASGDYLKMDTKWCEWLAETLPSTSTQQAAMTLKASLDDLGTRRSRGESGSIIIKEKKKAMQVFIKAIKGQT